MESKSAGGNRPFSVSDSTRRKLRVSFTRVPSTSKTANFMGTPSTVFNPALIQPVLGVASYHKLFAFKFLHVLCAHHEHAHADFLYEPRKQFFHAFPPALGMGLYHRLCQLAQIRAHHHC